MNPRSRLVRLPEPDRQASMQAGKYASMQASKQQASKQATRQAGKQVGRQASRQSGKQASRQAGKQAGKQTRKPVEKQKFETPRSTNLLARVTLVLFMVDAMHTDGTANSFCIDLTLLRPT